jgi:hypothetical protein
LRRLDNGYELTRLDRPACTAVQWDEPTKKCTVWFGPGHFEGLTDGSAKSIVAVRNKACGQSDWVKGEYSRGSCEGDLTIDFCLVNREIYALLSHLSVKGESLSRNCEFHRLSSAVRLLPNREGRVRSTEYIHCTWYSSDVQTVATWTTWTHPPLIETNRKEGMSGRSRGLSSLFFCCCLFTSIWSP